MNKVSEVVKSGLCTGCGLCATAKSAHVVMERSGGFLRPSGVEKISVIEQKGIFHACPGVSSGYMDVELESGQLEDRLWGKHLSVMAGHSTDSRVRKRGSSGGVITEIATYLLVNGLVNGVVVTIYDEANPIATLTKIARTPDEVLEAVGSKYSPSSPLTVLDTIHNAQGRFAVVGKPCDVAAFRMLINEDARLLDKIPYLLSFFCAGVPSDIGNTRLVEKIGVPIEELAKFQHRGDGWPGSAIATSKENIEKKLSYNESWGQVLSKHLQYRCKLCGDGVGEAADIVAADAWECDELGYPQFSEKDGESLIIARTSKGMELLTSVIEREVVRASDIDIRLIDKMQPGQLIRRRGLHARILALKILGRNTPRYSMFRLLKYCKKVSLSEYLKNFTGSFWRAIKR
ncbi:Coenzyme F420 hydrogenase/dehydrogenase, beta subunit C-terminal domain [Zhongshania aquimaris]|uniref:Coenzyme F420 hydrogenase/dehydrogenase, beta subunit C-terminal domain n=1 Tax=Zhongshania aquimaris TaxID=2857107 RepID=A0ABS6VRD9_9GAMM|nr:Coenzyme F420 hydrogenase/dehydrogenase, beta subunit C-terminal domain [Zhongshania aquimaris]MBW2940877.1 Coenzyme F420 hydrogenase/dehydrogenase, beta subunit C-terminal domain [Zhongshania aquimaris]